MTKLKYIRFRDDSLVVFSPQITHATAVPAGKNVKSAGFVMFTAVDDKIKAFAGGESISLNTKSIDEEDSELLTIFINS